MIRSEGRGGSMKVFWAMNSFSMSFWIVPPISFLLTPCFSATAIYMANKVEAGGLIVMEVVTLFKGIPSNKNLHVLQRIDGHTTFSDLAPGPWRIAVITHEGGIVKRNGEAGLTMVQEVVKTPVRFLRAS